MTEKSIKKNEKTSKRFLTKEKIISILKKENPFLKKKYHVSRLGIFGSYARGDYTEKSDVDILVEFSKPLGFEYFDLKQYVEQKLKKNVDLVNIKALHRVIKDTVLSESEFIKS